MTRPTALLLATLLPASLALSACGDEETTFTGFDAVTIGGEVGATPELDWKGTLLPGKSTVKIVSEGDGEEIAKDDVVRIDYTLANGYTHKINYDTYDEFTLGSLVKVGAQKDPESVSDLLTQAIVKEIEPGQTIGTRLAVTIGSEQLIGDYLGNAQVSQFFAGIDVGNEDGLLFVADLTALAAPSGAEEKAPAWAPEIVEKDGLPTSLDFKGVPAPSGKLRVATLVEGDGPKVESGQQILTSYLGQVYQGKAPFDESFSAGRGLEAVVGGKAASVVKGWSKGLVGLPVGSRVLLEIPPKLGYGKEGQGEDIPGNSTLYFIVDILDVADSEPVPEPVEPSAPAADPSSPSSTDPAEGSSE